MNQYNIYINDWHRPLSYLIRKVYKYNDRYSNTDNMCIANDINDI